MLDSLDTGTRAARLAERPGAVARTPAGLSSERVLAWRRIFVLSANLAVLGGLCSLMFYELSKGGWSRLDVGIFICFIMATPFAVFGFWNAAIGLWLAHGRRRGLREAAPHLTLDRGQGVQSRIAVLMTLRNEDAHRAFCRLAVLQQSIEATGAGKHFAYQVLSDTAHPEVAAAEEDEFARLRATAPDCAFYYRRRRDNTGYKAGNVREWIETRGHLFDLMLPMDADSLMAGDEVLRLVRIMEAAPRIGILQTLTIGTPASSPFARIFQFGMRQAMRPFTLGVAWWGGDSGPFWGHNALIRIEAFSKACVLPKLPGGPPLGGHVLSHDQVEAVLMRAGGYEVRVMPQESRSFEDNPPDLQEFTRRDLRWCQGNMQYWRLLALPGLRTLGRVQLLMAAGMYAGPPAWMAMIVMYAAKVFEAAPDVPAGDDGFNSGLALFILTFFMSLSAKFAGHLDTALTPGGMARYGGRLRYMAGALIEFLVMTLLMPIIAFRTVLFMAALPFGRAVLWNGQSRDAHGLSWASAFAGLWPQTLFGILLTAHTLAFAPGALPFAAPVLLAFLFAIPLAVVTASPSLGRSMARVGLCATPEEIAPPPEIAALQRAA